MPWSIQHGRAGRAEPAPLRVRSDRRPVASRAGSCPVSGREGPPVAGLRRGTSLLAVPDVAVPSSRGDFLWGLVRGQAGLLFPSG